MQIGISTYTYTWAFGVPGSLPEKPMNLYDLIEKAAILQVDCIQIADNYPLTGLPADELGKVKERAIRDRIGIEVGGRGLTEENLERYIDLAVFFGSPFLRMVIDHQDYQPTVETVVSVIRNALPALTANRIVLALENHDRLHAAVFKQIMDEVDSEFAGICLDCVNSMGIGEGIDTVLDNLAPYTVNLHVKDFSVKRVSHMMGFVIEGTPAGKGLLNVPAIVSRLRQYNRCHSAILELWTPPENSLPDTLDREETWARESIAYLKQIIQQP